VIRSGATEFRCEREVQPLPKIGRWSDELDQLLTANEGKPPRERLTLIRIFEELRGRGYEGGYDAVSRYARKSAKDLGQATAADYAVNLGGGATGRIGGNDERAIAARRRLHDCRRHRPSGRWRRRIPAERQRACFLFCL